MTAQVDREDFEDEAVEEEEDDIERKIEDRLNKLSPMPSASPKMRKEKVKQAAKKPALKIPDEQVEQWGQDEEESKEDAGIIEHNFQSEEEDNFQVYHEHQHSPHVEVKEKEGPEYVEFEPTQAIQIASLQGTMDPRPFSPPFHAANPSPPRNVKKASSVLRDSLDDKARGTVENEAGEIVEVLYDPILKCYYDPKANTYYELLS